MTQQEEKYVRHLVNAYSRTAESDHFYNYGDDIDITACIHHDTDVCSIESQLDAWTFLRISRHEIINTDKIRKYDFTVSGMPRLELAGGIETWVARRCIPALRKRLKGKAESV